MLQRGQRGVQAGVLVRTPAGFPKATTPAPIAIFQLLPTRFNMLVVSL